MTLKDDTPGSASAAYDYQATGGGAAAAPQQDRKWSFFGSGNLGGISRNPTSEVLTKAMAKLTEFYKDKLNIDKPLEVTLLPVDNSKETALYLSGICVAVRNANEKSLGVSYHILLLEGSNEAMTPRMESWQNQQVVVDRVAGDVLDAKYMSVAHGIVLAAFPGHEAYANSGQVVPRTFNWEDDDAVRNLAVNAVYPDVTDLETRMGAPDIDLSTWARDSALQVQLNFNEPDRTDYSGMPVRNNIAITLTAIDNTKTNTQTVNSQERTKRISHLGGFIDLIWAPDPGMAVHQFGNIQQQGPQYKFSPRFVMTNLENELRMTPASQLLAMVTALTLRENNNWYPYYQPRPPIAGGKQVDLRDIGAINFEANIMNEPSGYGQRIDVKTASFTPQDLGRLLSATIRPQLTFSLDVSECGSDTWYNEIFAAASTGALAAQEDIIHAANVLTGGQFSPIYNSSEGPVIVNEDRIHLGYYIGQDGQKHDIREIDYLAVLNLQGDTDIAAAQAWSDTFLRTDFPLAKRLMERKRMIVDLIRADVVFTGFARRVTFNGRFLEALAAACKAAGLDTRVTSPSFGGDYTSSRASAGWLPQSAVQPGVSGLFNMGISQPQNTFGMGSGFGTRWGGR